MIKCATILTESPLNDQHIDCLNSTIVKNLLNNGAVAEITIAGDMITITGLFQRGVNQAVLAIGAYLKHNAEITFIWE